MKTRGIVILDGSLILPVYRSVPDAFWARLKHEIQKRYLVDEFKADRDAEGMLDGFVWEKEERLFRRWVERLGLASEPWPWERGWTEELVDSYLIAPVKALEAA
jgi:hypothetical protein